MSIERKHRPGGHFRSIKRFNQYREAAERAQEEIKMFKIGEPSKAFYSFSENVIYLSDKLKKRKEPQRRERETVATSQDIANRHKEQLERYVELEYYAGHPAKLPPEWRRIGVKYWDEIQTIKGNSITLSSAKSSLSFGKLP